MVYQIHNHIWIINGTDEFATNTIDNPKEIKKHLLSISQAADKISIINGKIIKYRNGTGDEIEIVNANGILEECISMLASFFMLKNIDIEGSLYKPAPSIQANIFELEQIFNNLVLNAFMLWISARGNI